MIISNLISIFRGSNFLEYMWPSFALLQAFGFFPYKISRGILSASIPGYVYASSTISILTLTVIHLAYCINFSNAMNYESVPALLQSDCYLFFGYLYCLSSFICSKRKLKLFKIISKISYHVPKCKWNHSAIFIHAKDLLGFLFLIGQMPNTLKGNILDVAVKLICSYITLVIYLLDNLFVNCVLAIKIIFKNVNSDLEIFEGKVISQECYNVGRLMEDNHNNSQNLLTEIRILRKKFEDLCGVIESTNEAFSMSIIISIGLTFVEVTFSLYFYILKSIGAQQINLEKQIWYFYFITSATYYSSKFLTAVWTCETTKKEAQKSRVIVHRILLRLHNREIIQELQSFSLQMIQRNISFSVHGIPLDGSLVSRIAGGISTYILILIQFMIASSQCSNNERN